MTKQHRTARMVMVAAGLIAALTPLVIAIQATAASCSSTVIFTTPGVTWADVARLKPPTLISLSQRGAIGSMSVHTDLSRPSYPSAFTTMGAGARVPGFEVAPVDNPVTSAAHLARDVTVANGNQLHALSVRSGYDARPGALAGALSTPVVAIGDAAISPTQGFAEWPLLAAMEPSGSVGYAATGTTPIGGASGHLQADPVDIVKAARKALALGCATVVIDPGDLERAQASPHRSRAMSRALMSSDRLLAALTNLLDLQRDLVLVITPTSPPAVTHLGVAVAVGPGFSPGSTLESASTRRPGIVTLPDVAPTVLAHLGVSQPAVMTGQPFFSVMGAGDRIAAAVSLDRDAVFIDASKPAMSWVFLAAELVFFVAALLVLRRRSTRPDAAPPGVSELVTPAALAVASLPVATYAVDLVAAPGLGRIGFIGLCLVVDGGIVALISLLRLSALDRLGVVALVSLIVIVGDLITRGHLQPNSILGDSPLIAGRFAGAGNNAFAILASTAVVVATLVVWRRGNSRAVMLGVAFLFIVVVLVDGAPQFGSDVGGVLALVPGFAATWILLARRRISMRVVAVGLIAAVAAAGLFIAIDVSRPPEQRTHLGRFFEDIRSRGSSAFFETVRRKAASNLRQVRSLQNLYRFLPAALVTALCLLWPLRWWKWFGSQQPLLRAGVLGGLVVAVLGSALNDSGITIFTTMLLFFAPLVILTRLRFPAPADVVPS
jgi:hypothetical protein